MEFSKYIHVLHLLTQVPDHKTVSDEDAVQFWDLVFDFIHANWPVPAFYRSEPGASFDCNDEFLKCAKECHEGMLQLGQTEFEALLETLPPHYSEIVFPVAVGRYLLRECQLPLRHCDTRTFSEFHRRYGAMILW